MKDETSIPSILIVDDDEADRYLLRRDFKAKGLAPMFFESTNGADAIQFIEQGLVRPEKHQPGTFPPALILVDINMPILGGFGFVEKFESLRAERTELTSAVIMMISSSMYQADIDRAMSFDAVDGYVTKAFGHRGAIAGSILDTYQATVRAL